MQNFYISFLQNKCCNCDINYKFKKSDKSYVNYTGERNLNQLNIAKKKVDFIAINNILFIVKLNRKLSGKELMFMVSGKKDSIGQLELNKTLLNPQLFNSRYFTLSEDLIESNLYPN